MPYSRALLAAFLILIASAPLAADDSLVVDSPMPPPGWALMEQKLLKANGDYAELFADRYIDERGYLLHTIRWGTLDGPDDAIESFYNWTLAHALGGPDSILKIFKKALDGHYDQYGKMRTVQTKLAENGAYHREFITQSDWFHTGEGMRGIMGQGLSDPTDSKLRSRMTRFAGLYMNEDPAAPNYDPEKKLIKSLWTGSKGPMMHKATTYDWVGDLTPGWFHILHGPGGRSQLVNMETVYDKMLAHCAEYLDSVGDHPLNMASTGLGLRAYALTHDDKYRDWVIEYMDAWKARTAETGGMIPTNVGLDGKVGGEYNGQWWKGTYGWNFTIFDGEIEKIAHRNTYLAGSWPGFSNAFLLTGDMSYIETLRKQLDLIYAQKKVENGKELFPTMYGDPRHHNQNGKPEWYQFRENAFPSDRALETYLWSMDRQDLRGVPVQGWLAYIEGKDPDYPEKALQAEFAQLRRKVQQVHADDTTPDTRLADYLMGFSSLQTHALTNLMTGGYLTGNIWTLHSRLRYFDPVKRRSGVPEGVSALVDNLADDSVAVTLVNVDQTRAHPVIVQAGGYGEHQFTSVSINGKTTQTDSPVLNVHLEPGSGARIVFKMKRYTNRPTLAQPWDRGWMVKD